MDKSTGIWQRRLDAIADGTSPSPGVVEKLSLGRLTKWHEGYVEKEWTVEPQFCTAEGTSEEALFGGYLAALADQVLAFAAMTVLEDNQHFRTTELSISYFNKISKGRIAIRGSVVNRNSRLIHVSADFLREDGKLAARATAVQILLTVNENVIAAMKLGGMEIVSSDE